MYAAFFIYPLLRLPYPDRKNMASTMRSALQKTNVQKFLPHKRMRLAPYLKKRLKIQASL